MSPSITHDNDNIIDEISIDSSSTDSNMIVSIINNQKNGTENNSIFQGDAETSNNSSSFKFVEKFTATSPSPLLFNASGFDYKMFLEQNLARKIVSNAIYESFNENSNPMDNYNDNYDNKIFNFEIESK